MRLAPGAVLLDRSSIVVIDSRLFRRRPPFLAQFYTVRPSIFVQSTVDGRQPLTAAGIPDLSLFVIIDYRSVGIDGRTSRLSDICMLHAFRKKNTSNIHQHTILDDAILADHNRYAIV